MKSDLCNRHVIKAPMIALAAYTKEVHGEPFTLAGVLKNGREGSSDSLSGKL